MVLWKKLIHDWYRWGKGGGVGNRCYQLQREWKVTGRGMTQCWPNYDNRDLTKSQIVLHGEKARDSRPTVVAGVEGKIRQPAAEINAAKPVTFREKSSLCSSAAPSKLEACTSSVQCPHGGCSHRSECVSPYERNILQIVCGGSRVCSGESKEISGAKFA